MIEIPYIQGLIDEHIENTREEKERKSFYITDLAKCPRGVFLARLGQEPTEPLEDRVKRIFFVGNTFEDIICDILEEHQNVELKTQGSIVFDEYDFRGRYDALIEKDGHAHVVEFKTMHSRGFHWMSRTGERAKPHHIEQLMCYMHKLKDEYESIKGSVVYISKDDLCIKQSTFSYDENMMKDILRRMALMKAAWDAKQIPDAEKAIVFDEGKKKYAVNWKAKYCDYHDQCTQNKNWLKEAESEVRRLNKK